MLIGEKIKELREKKGLTRYKLRKIIGANNSSITRWEEGSNEPNIFNCILLADVFGVSLDELACRDFKGGK